MVALTIGTIISLALVALYAQAVGSYAFDRQYRALQQNAQIASQILLDDLSMVDFWGRIVATDNITTPLSSSGCAASIDAFEPDTGLLVANYHPSTAHETFTTCSAVSSVRHGNTDLLVVKRVAGAPARVSGASTSSLSDGPVYLRSNDTVGELINDARSAGAASDEQDWLYEPSLFFVRQYSVTPGDGIPTLCRLRLSGSSNLSSTECIAEGVDDFHVEFGIDTDSDGFANLYTGVPSLSDLETAVTARIHLLMRTPQPVPGYTDQKTYQLGAHTVTAANDGYMRRLFTSTVVLRNTVDRSLLQ